MTVKARWLYPFRGITYFLSNPRLWPRVILPFVILLLVTIALLILAFTYLMPLQADFLIRHSWPSWIAYTVSVLFTLLEAALGSLVVYLALMPLWEDALFDAVLRSRKLGYIIDAAHGDYRTCINGVLASIYIIVFQSTVLLLFQVVTLIVLLPLHAVPVVGTIIYCYLNGWVVSFSKRIHYDVELCKKNVSQSRKYAWEHRVEYCEFGAVAVFLEMTPVLNLLFFWTNVVGAALWVADEIDEARRQDRIASRTAADHGHFGSQYVTFHSYGTSSPGLPTEPLLAGHTYENHGGGDNHLPPQYQYQASPYTVHQQQQQYQQQQQQQQQQYQQHQQYQQQYYQGQQHTGSGHY